jgi:hypothetical protein
MTMVSLLVLQVQRFLTAEFSECDCKSHHPLLKPDSVRQELSALVNGIAINLGALF